MMVRRSQTLTACLFGLPVALGAGSALAVPFSYVDLNPPGESFCRADALNVAGQVAVVCTGANNKNRLYIWKEGKSLQIKFPGPVQTISIAGITPWGLASGTIYTDPDNVDEEGFVFSTIQRKLYFLNIDHFPFEVGAVNNQAQIAGYVLRPYPYRTAQIYQYGMHFVIPRLPDYYNGVHFAGLNSAGQLLLLTGEGFAVFFDGKNYVPVEFPGSTSTLPNVLSDSGDVGGFYDEPLNKNVLLHGFILSHGIYRTLDVPGALTTSVEALNARGEALGNYYVDSDGSHIFLSSAGTIQNVDPPHVASPSATALSEVGWFIGTYKPSPGQQRAFVAICAASGASCMGTGTPARLPK